MLPEIIEQLKVLCGIFFDVYLVGWRGPVRSQPI